MTREASPNAKFLLSLGAPLQFVALHPSSNRVQCWASPSQDTLYEALKRATDLNENGWNIYYEVNVGRRCGSRSKAQDITHLRAVVGDVDITPSRSTEQCRDLVGALPIQPTFTLFTGGGLQVVFLLSDWVPVTAERQALYEKAGRALRDLICGDAVFDLPRIMRVPGFINHPNEKKRAMGRTPVPAAVEFASDITYRLEEIVQALTPASVTTSESKGQSRSLADDIESGLAQEPWFDRLAPADKDACLKSILTTPGILALADTSDASPDPNWRTVLAACTRSDAPSARDLAREWAATSDRFDETDFASRWNSYARA